MKVPGIAAAAPGTASPRLVPRGIALFAFLFAVFHLSPHVTVTDSRYSLLVSEVLLTTGTLRLDGMVSPSDYRAYRKAGSVRLYFPEAGSVLAVPFMALVRPFGGSVFDGEGRFDPAREDALQKLFSALLCAAAGVVLWRLAARFASERAALVIAVSACLASPVWSSTSRALWTDTWGFLLLSLALLMAVKPLRGPGLVVLGTVLSWMYFVKPTYSVPVAAITAVVLWRQGWRSWLLPFTGAVWLAAFVFWSLHVNGTLQPDYFRASRLGESNLATSLAPHLFSPSRGLLVYFPFAVWAVWMVAANWRRLRDRDLAVAAFFVMVLHYAVHGSHSATAGHCYGARFSGPLIPWFVLLAAMGWDAATRRPGPGRSAAFAWGLVLVLWGVAVNARGALEPRTWRWNNEPANIDEAPERLWDWRRPQFAADLLPGVIDLPPVVPVLSPVLDFRKPSSSPFLVGAWSGPEEDGRWSCGTSAGLAFSAEPGRGIVLRLTARTFGPQQIICHFNGERVRSIRTEGDAWFTETFSLPATRVGDWNMLEFRFPDRRSPAGANPEGDRRELGLMVRTLVSLPAGGPSPASGRDEPAGEAVVERDADDHVEGEGDGE